LREFLHVDDLAEGLVHLLKNYSDAPHMNVGSGTEVSISDLAHMVAKTVGYSGKVLFDPSKPDGTPRKLMDNGKISALGWSPRICLQDGLKDAYTWYYERVLSTPVVAQNTITPPRV
jgi:GDP-L-fucose synthase